MNGAMKESIINSYTLNKIKWIVIKSNINISDEEKQIHVYITQCKHIILVRIILVNIN